MRLRPGQHVRCNAVEHHIPGGEARHQHDMNAISFEIGSGIEQLARRKSAFDQPHPLLYGIILAIADKIGSAARAAPELAGTLGAIVFRRGNRAINLRIDGLDERQLILSLWLRPGGRRRVLHQPTMA